jgi:hypothetical protein
MSLPNPQDPNSPLYLFVDTQPLSAYPNNPDISPSHFTVRQKVPIAITATRPVHVTCMAHGFLNGQAIRATKFLFYPIANATGMQQLNNRLFYVQNASLDEFDLFDANGFPLNGIGFTPFVQGGEFTLAGNTPLIVNPSHFPPPGI